MAASAYQTAVNVKFAGTNSNAVVLLNNSGTRSLIVCDKTNTVEMAMLDSLIAAYGGVAPAAGPFAGKQTLNFKGTVVAGNATGLSSVAAATAGVATINVGGAKAGGSATGLSTYIGTPGYQEINFVAAKAGGTATGLANDATAYTASITVDGVLRNISIVGSAAQTFTTLLAEINTDLAGSGTATLVNGDIRVTSASSGSTSKVSIATTGTLLAALGYANLTVAVPGDGAARQYGATVIVDGVVKPVVLSGNSAQTYTNLLAQINTDLGASATASISGGNLIITSATTGLASSVVVIDAGLFSALTSFVGITSVNGTAPTTYTATIAVDGVSRNISIVGSAAQTFTTLLTEINADMTGATAAIVAGNIVLTSATTGANSKVVVTDPGTLFKSLNGFFGFDAPRDGAADLLAVVRRERTPSGATYAEVFNIEVVGPKPPVQPNTPKNKHFIYHNGTSWRYLLDDTAV